MTNSGPAAPGMLLIISGPSGVGKTTITHHVERELCGVFSVSVTTRPQTHKDTQGKDYDFVDRTEFERRQRAGELLEWAEVFGHCYGTPRLPVEQAIFEGHLVILEIDVEGAVLVKQQILDAFALFVLPPSEQVLLHRLRHRQRESEEIIQRRFAKAKLEIERAHTSGVYDVFVVNDQLEQASAEAVELVRQERADREQGARTS